jgi:uncharacterized protein with beta-barrel porin domain
VTGEDSGGGAIYNYSSTLAFSSSAVNFTGNSTNGKGGAIYNNGQIIFDTLAENNITFTGNAAALGNDIYQTEQGTTAIRGSGNVTISSGIAGSGLITKDGSGTFYINGDSSEYKGTFEQNGGKTIVSSASFGGTHNINSLGILEFAAGSTFTSGSSYVLNGGLMEISASSDLTLGNQVSGNGKITKDGIGKLTFSGDIRFEDAIFEASSGEAAFAAGASYTGETFIIDGATLDMRTDSPTEEGEEITVNHFESKTNTKIDVYENGNSDKITATTAIIGGKLNIRVGAGAYENIAYELIIATGAAGGLSGEFASSSIINAFLKYELSYASDIVRLVISGIAPSDFGEISGLSYNQEQTAKTFDEMSIISTGEWNEILLEMYNKKKDGGREEIAEVKEFLAQTSGYFLSNVIRNAAAGSHEVYDKIRGTVNNGLWGQIKGGAETFSGDDNSIGAYQNASMGLVIGFDKYMEERSMILGVYARLDKDSIEQERNKADGSKSGIGVYGGYMQEKYEIKAMLLGSYDIFSAVRAVMGRTAKSDISAFTISADAEGSLKYEISREVNFKPYFGLELEDANYGSFKESGAGIYDLDVEGGSYIKSAARIGAGIEYEQRKWKGYARAEGKYLLSGSTPEIESRFRDTQIKFKSRGSEEGNLEIGVAAGGEVRVARDFLLYANINYYGAERYSNVYGNAGVRYIFE